LSFSPKKHVFFLKNRQIVAFYTFDPPCGVTEGYFRGVWHCFGRGKTPGRRCKNCISKKKGFKSKKKTHFFLHNVKKIKMQKNRRGLAVKGDMKVWVRPHEVFLFVEKPAARRRWLGVPRQTGGNLRVSGTTKDL